MSMYEVFMVLLRLKFAFFFSWTYCSEPQQFCIRSLLAILCQKTMPFMWFECHGEDCQYRCEVDPSKCTCASGSKCAAQEAAYWAGCGQTWQVKGCDKFYCIACLRRTPGYEAKAARKASKQFAKWKASMVCKSIKKSCKLKQGEDSSPQRWPRSISTSSRSSISSYNSLNHIDVVVLQDRVEVLEKLFQSGAFSEDARLAKKVAEAVEQHLQQLAGPISFTTRDTFHRVQLEDVNAHVIPTVCNTRLDSTKQEDEALVQH